MSEDADPTQGIYCILEIPYGTMRAMSHPTKQQVIVKLIGAYASWRTRPSSLRRVFATNPVILSQTMRKEVSLIVRDPERMIHQLKARQ